jgi:hypothetical protein
LPVSGDLFLVDAQCSGEVRLNGARIGGRLNLNRGVFANPGGTAIAGDDVVVDSSMSLNKARCRGRFDSRAHISAGS